MLLQWEDFATAHALPILERYRDKLLTFNDDIQGTAAVALGALHGASKVAGRPLSQQQVVMLGAGSAGIGVLDMVHREMVAQGLSEQDAAARIWVVDIVGLLTDDRTDLSEGQRKFAQPADRVAGWGLSGHAQLADVVHNVDVGVLLGLSTAAGAFTEQIVRELAAKTDRPIIFPLSNPTSRAEAHPAELDEWTDGRALIATGSPFAPLHRDGVERPVAQCNNVYIFPAMGLAVTAAQATRVTDEMMRVAAATLGDASPALADPGEAAAARVVRCSRRRRAHRPRRRHAGGRRRGRSQAQRRRDGRPYRRGALEARVPLGVSRHHIRRNKVPVRTSAHICATTRISTEHSVMMGR